MSGGKGHAIRKTDLYMDRLEFVLAKAVYLLNYSTQPGEGGDKRRFWREIMGFQSPDALRAAIMDATTLELLQRKGENAYGILYEATIPVSSPLGVTRSVRTAWIVRFRESHARFVTAYPIK
jgi:hypothetical protein